MIITCKFIHFTGCNEHQAVYCMQYVVCYVYFAVDTGLQKICFLSARNSKIQDWLPKSNCKNPPNRLIDIDFRLCICIAWFIYCGCCWQLYGFWLETNFASSHQCWQAHIAASYFWPGFCPGQKWPLKYWIDWTCEAPKYFFLQPW